MSSFSLVSLPEFSRPGDSVRPPGALHPSHIDDLDAQHMWTMLR